MTSTGTPCCRAIDATTAGSFAAASMSLPARPLPRKISAKPIGAGKVRHGRDAAVRPTIEGERRGGTSIGQSLRERSWRTSLVAKPYPLLLPAGEHFALLSGAGEQFDERAGAARLDERVLLVRFARMLALAALDEIHLTSAPVRACGRQNL